MAVCLANRARCHCDKLHHRRRRNRTSFERRAQRAMVPRGRAVNFAFRRMTPIFIVNVRKPLGRRP